LSHIFKVCDKLLFISVFEENMKITISDIAKRAHVSAMTVSRVINNKGPVKKETRERIERVIEELDYKPNLFARSLSSKKSMMIGVIINRVKQVFFDNYIGQISSGVTDAAAERNYRVMFFPVETNHNHASAYYDIVRSHIPDGLIILRSKIDDPHIQVLAEHDVPFVLVNHKKYKKNYNFVDTENIKGVEMAMNYLFARGHKKIAFVAGSMDETNSRDRLKGYRMALEKHGVEYRDAWVLYGDFNRTRAYEETGKLWQDKNRPTAILAADDYMAIGAMQRIQDEGLAVPDDISIIGFDDVELASYTKPALTTIRQPLVELGDVAAKSLIDIIEDKQKAPVHKFLKVELIERDSA